jgi:HEAT repeat protein
MAEEVARRRRAAVVAGHRGDSETARSLVDDPDASVRAAALGALWRCASLAEGDLTRALGDHDPRVRRRALELIAALEATTPAHRATRGLSILDLLDDADPTVVEVAAWACGERRPPEPDAAARLAVLATGAEDALVREAAVAALGAIGDPTGLPAILHATRDKATVRRRAVLALAPFEGAEVTDALTRALEDRDWQVRQAAEDLTQH